MKRWREGSIWRERKREVFRESERGKYLERVKEGSI